MEHYLMKPHSHIIILRRGLCRVQGRLHNYYLLILFPWAINFIFLTKSETMIINLLNRLLVYDVYNIGSTQVLVWFSFVPQLIFSWYLRSNQVIVWFLAMVKNIPSPKGCYQATCFRLQKISLCLLIKQYTIIFHNFSSSYIHLYLFMSFSH